MILEEIPGLTRTHKCGELTKTHIGKGVTLCGWVNKYRNLGGLHFVDIRDKYGVTQLSFEKFQGDLSILKEISLESVIKVTGIVKKRPPEAINDNMSTGEIEVHVQEINILSKAHEVPFLPYGHNQATEELKLKYRYLDLRSEKLQNILKMRSNTLNKIRNFFHNHDFIEVETPILYKSTPEGARDFIVPSRIHKHKVFALPQSPQTLKQLLMISGTDKYFQIAKCFRDEDLRADRQPEFTQLDIEVSFSSQNYIKKMMEHFTGVIFSNQNSSKKNISIPTMSYAEAIKLYGSDKPDIRFDLKHLTVTHLFIESSFSLFKNIVDADGTIKAIFLPKSDGEMTRKEIDALKDVVSPFGLQGVAWFKSADGQISGGIGKFIDEKLFQKLVTLQQENHKDSSTDGIWLFVASNESSLTHAGADALRRHLGKKFNLIKEGYHFLWVNDFPLLEYNDDLKRFQACHHPFTSVKKQDLELFYSNDQEDLKKCRAEAYDLVCNGHEIGGGSMRIFGENLQTRMFEVLGMDKNTIESQFGFFIEALKYGTPPHGGIALGVDRMIMILAQTDNIRDVMAFPKTTRASDMMSGSPSTPSQEQIKELYFNWNK